MMLDPRELERHEFWMRRCLELAKNGAGRVSPNPMVGAVLVDSEGGVLGEGWHGAYGGPHAEVWAVRDALRRHEPEALRTATLYVGLEPCSHHGKTPPCADFVIEHGIPRVVAGMEDPNPRVGGQGFRRLREAGVEVISGILESACFRLNEAFVHHVLTGRPLVTLKTAQTLDGQVATALGDSRWISGKAARTLVHRWRSELDAVLIGRGTAEADDPSLTVRHVEGRQPVRVVLDEDGSLRPDLKLLTDDFVVSTVVAVGRGVEPPYGKDFKRRGGRILEVERPGAHRIDLMDLLRRLGAEGGAGGRPLQSILVEAGRSLASSFFREDLVDRYFLFVAPKIVGTGVASIGDLGITRMDDAMTFEEWEWEQVGDDLLFRGYLRPAVRPNDD
ncbi:MAG TPA: bifunctional diaminohydroxyphosphoribosylaminopyrimidine deaminase/5-amino-6-(5-phosphoribosylamino)uracil reductase RibD [Rhodothermales bacterium]